MKKKIWLTSFLMVGIASASLGAYAMNESVTANAAGAFAMQNGASVRLTEGSTGIRFTAHADEIEEGANYGVIIAPTAYFMNDGEYVTGNYHEYLNEKYNVKEGEEVTDLGYIDLASKPTEVTDDESDYYGKYAIKGSIAQINYENMNLSFTGIAYKEVEGVYTYASFEKIEDVSRSVTNVSSRATQYVDYETRFTESERTVIENFLLDGIAQAAGATKSETTYTYNDAQYDIAGLMGAIKPSLTITEVNTLSLLRKAEVTATFSVAGADLNYEWSATGAISYADGSVQAVEAGEGTLTVSVGPMTATEEIVVPQPIDMTTAGYVVADMDNANAISTTIEGFNVSYAEEIYEVKGANEYVDLQYANGALGATLTTGEKQIYALARDGETYKLAGIASDCVIDNATEYEAWAKNQGSAQYAILTSNITMNANTVLQGSTPFKGTFNGLGHTVYNAAHYYGIFGYGHDMKNTAVFKNVTYENLVHKKNGLLGFWNEGGLIENVHIRVSQASRLDSVGTANRTLISVHVSIASPLTIKNSSIIYTVADAHANEAFTVYNDDNFYVADLENVNIASNAPVYGVGENASATLGVNTGKANWKRVEIVDGRKFNNDTKYLVASENVISVDFGAKAKAVYVNGQSVAATAGEGTVTKIPVTTYGKSSIIAQLSDGSFKAMNTVFADYAATDLASYKAFWTTDSIYLNSKYMVITANINCGDAWIESKKDKTLSSVIDGLGHTISNVNTSYGLFGGNTSNITVKNVTFDNFMMADYGNGRLLGRWCNNMVYENVHFTNFTIADNFFTKDTNCLFSWVSAGGAYILKLTNCTFDIKCSNANVDKEITFVQLPNKYVSYFTNVTINYNGTVATYDETITHNSNGGKVTSLTNVVINDKTGTKTYNN